MKSDTPASPASSPASAPSPAPAKAAAPKPGKPHLNIGIIGPARISTGLLAAIVTQAGMMGSRQAPGNEGLGKKDRPNGDPEKHPIRPIPPPVRARLPSQADPDPTLGQQEKA